MFDDDIREPWRYSFRLKAFLMSLMSSVESELKYQLFEKKYFKCIFTLEAIVTSSLNIEENELALYT